MNEVLKELRSWFALLIKKPVLARYFLTWRNSKDGGSDALSDAVPWITFAAREWLNSFLRKDMTVFEWGSGGSTLYISKKVKEIVSVEHDSEWYKKVSKILAVNHVHNCELLLKLSLSNKNVKRERIPGFYLSNVEACRNLSFENYCKAIEKHPKNYFDLVIVDGRARISCIYHARNKVKRGGFLMLDNSERDEYVPGINLLKSWRRKDFFGPGPFNPYFWQTSIFQKLASK